MTNAPVTTEAVELTREEVEQWLRYSCGDLCKTKGGIWEVMQFLCRFWLAAQSRQDEARDTKRMDYLEGEYDREQCALRKGESLPRSLFRRNLPITRAAIDAALSKEPPQ